MPKVILTSNRLPVTITSTGDSLQFQPSVGGLATGLSELAERQDIAWVGWHGHGGREDSPKLKRLSEEMRQRRLYPVHLNPRQLQGYYKDFANGALWPLYHYQVERMPLRLAGWDEYVEVNNHFADTVAALYEAGDMVWVHDYHLQLLPKLLRDRLPGARIGFFLHVPFPVSEIFRVLPWRAEILAGLLGADVIGFHTHAYARHFRSSLLRILGIDARAEAVRHDGRLVRIGAFPLGVNVAQFETQSTSAPASDLVDAVTAMRQGGRCRHLLLSIDRLDYTKGILRRLLAMERLLEREPDLRGVTVLVQIAAPSRDDVDAYGKYRRQVEGLVGRINGRFGMPGYQPIHYVSRAFSQEEIIETYRRIDVMIVTPLRDGMNLVAKEFVAARADLGGVLVLSEFAGAASELGEAVHVNPYDIDGTAAGISSAIHMETNERNSRMKALRGRVTQFDASTWAQKFLEFLRGEPEDQGRIEYAKPAEIQRLIPDKEKIALFLDYDGTLFPIVRIPQLAAPDRPLLALLELLAANPRFEIHIVSGRAHGVMDSWFADKRLHLHAEHGAMTRAPGAVAWTAAASHPTADQWQSSVRPLLEDFVHNTPGSFIEEKTFSLAWHYRMSDLQHGERMAKELRLHGREIFAPLGLETLSGKRVVEIRPLGISKAVSVGRELERLEEQAAGRSIAIAVGDDATDEEMFAAMPATGITIVVGPRRSQAQHRLRDPAEVRRLLELLARPGGLPAMSVETAR